MKLTTTSRVLGFVLVAGALLLLAAAALPSFGEALVQRGTKAGEAFFEVALLLSVCVISVGIVSPFIQGLGPRLSGLLWSKALPITIGILGVAACYAGWTFFATPTP